MDDCLVAHDRRVVDQVARLKIVGAVDDDVVVLDHVEDILRVQRESVLDDLDVGLIPAIVVGRRIDLEPGATESDRWRICRWRFETSTVSKSTMPSVPTPAAAR